MGNLRAAAAAGNGPLRGRERSAQVRQWELLATKTIHCANSPRNTEQARGSKRSQGRESRLGTRQGKRSTSSGRPRVLGPREGSTETADQGDLASQLWWEADATVGKREAERWGRRDSGTGRLNESERPELRPESHLKHLPQISIFLPISTYHHIGRKTLLVSLGLKCENISTWFWIFLLTTGCSGGRRGTLWVPPRPGSSRVPGRPLTEQGLYSPCGTAFLACVLHEPEAWSKGRLSPQTEALTISYEDIKRALNLESETWHRVPALCS